MANRLVFLDFPSTVHTNFYGVIYTAISPVYITSVFLWYGHANNLAGLLNEKGKLSVLVENLMANRLVFLDFPSTVHTNLWLL